MTPDEPQQPSQPPTVGFIAVPEGSPTPAHPGAAYGPLTAEEREQFAYLRGALSGLDSTLTLEPMRVVHDGRPRVVLVAVKDAGDEVLATPLALMMDGDLFEQMSGPTRTGSVVMKDDDPAVWCEVDGCGRSALPCACGAAHCDEHAHVEDDAPCCRAQVTAGRDSGEHEPGCPNS